MSGKRDDLGREPTRAEALEAVLRLAAEIGLDPHPFLLRAVQAERRVLLFAKEKGIGGDADGDVRIQLPLLVPHLPALVGQGLLFSPSVLYALSLLQLRVSDPRNKAEIRLLDRTGKALGRSSAVRKAMRIRAKLNELEGARGNARLSARATGRNVEDALDEVVAEHGFKDGESLRRVQRRLKQKIRPGTRKPPL